MAPLQHMAGEVVQLHQLRNITTMAILLKTLKLYGQLRHKLSAKAETVFEEKEDGQAGNLTLANSKVWVLVKKCYWL